jgi:pimeloyl-ACP methyl ester carboxylesterase
MKADWRFLYTSFAALLIALLTGCITPSIKHAETIGSTAALVREYIATPLFTYTIFIRTNDPTQTLHVYIEGDGVAWLSRYQPSSDPTPDEPAALKLAALDPTANVVYLARPCQFTPRQMTPRCQATYWTDKRFAPEVIDSISQALDQIKTRTHTSRLALIGYSGGGAVAALLAEKRHDIESLRTIAGYLDVAYVNQLHQVSAMPESLNPIDQASALIQLPQIHFSGQNDHIIPSDVAARFVARTSTQCAQTIPVAGMSHHGPWEREWPRLLYIAPTCQP